MYYNVFNADFPFLAAKQKRIINEHQGMTPTMIAPGTTVYELVEELVKYLSEEMKEKFAGEYNGSGYNLGTLFIRG